MHHLAACFCFRHALRATSFRGFQQFEQLEKDLSFSLPLQISLQRDFKDLGVLRLQNQCFPIHFHCGLDIHISWEENPRLPSCFIP